VWKKVNLKVCYRRAISSRENWSKNEGLQFNLTPYLAPELMVG
jgi:hypothetical protein